MKQRKSRQRDIATTPSILNINMGMLEQNDEWKNYPDSGMTDNPRWAPYVNGLAEITRLATPSVYHRLHTKVGEIHCNHEGSFQLSFNANWGDLEAACFGFCISEREMQSPGVAERISDDKRMLGCILRQDSSVMQPDNGDKAWSLIDWAAYPKLPTKHLQSIVSAVLGAALHMPMERTDLKYIFVGGDRRWYDIIGGYWKKFSSTTMSQKPLYVGKNAVGIITEDS